MRRRLPVALAVPATALVFSTMVAIPAPAATIPTTPTPVPANPGQPPASQPFTPQPLGHAVGDAAAAVGDIQLFPGGVDTTSILPGGGQGLPKQALFEGGLGLSSAQANSEAYLSYERAVAESTPIGGSIGSNAPSLPGALRQTALPDNPQPTTGGLNLPQNPLLNVGLLNGSAHARWSDTLGPCVGTISDASTSVASLSVLNSANLPDLTGGLDQIINPAALAQLPATAQQALKKQDPSKVLALVAPQVGKQQDKAADGKIALLDVPNAISSRSTVKLVDLPHSANKAVQSTSRLQLADIKLLEGIPFVNAELKVVSQPSLTVTSTGKKETSTVDYNGPAFDFLLNGQSLGRVDAQHPLEQKMGLPIPDVLKKLKPPQQAEAKAALTQEGLPSNFDALGGAPLVGPIVSKIQKIAEGQDGVLDLGLLKLTFGQLQQTGKQQVKGVDGAPFNGYQLAATGNVFKLELLPTDKLNLTSGPSSVLEADLGKQVGRAYAPTNGVECGTTQPPAAKPVAHVQPPKQVKPPLAYTDAAYKTVPLFWTGTGLLLVGAVLVAALPNRRVRKAVARR